MKKLLVLGLLSPLSACAAASWSALDADPASPTSLRAAEAPRPTPGRVLADADPLRAPSGFASGAEPTGGAHAGHHGHHGGAEGQGAGHANHGAPQVDGEHAGHGTAGTSDQHANHGTEQRDARPAPDAGTPASSHAHHH